VASEVVLEIEYWRFPRGRRSLQERAGRWKCQPRVDAWGDPL